MSPTDDLFEIEKAVSDKSAGEIFAERYPDAPPEVVELYERIVELDRTVTTLENGENPLEEEEEQESEKEAYLRKLIDPQ